MDYSLYVYEKKEKKRKKERENERKKEKNYVNFKFSGESKGGQNNKVLEKLRNQKKSVLVNQSNII